MHHHAPADSSVPRILIIIVCIAVIVAGYAYRWRRASAASDARAAQITTERTWSQQLLQHPALPSLLAFIRSQGIAADFGPAPAGQYEIVFLSLTNALGQATAPGDPQAVCLQAFLQGPKRLSVGMMLQTGQAGVTELGYFQWRPDMDAVRFQRSG